MPKGSPELIQVREQEIISACEELYKTRRFQEITLKEIADATSFTRTSIYNYFQTKEEIFLALHQREYELWNGALTDILEQNESLSCERFADAIAHSLEERTQLLKLMSMNHYDMESKSRLERLAAFKTAYGNAIHLFTQCVEKFFPEKKADEVNGIVYAFFPFMFGIYPYAVVNEQQKLAMEKANVNYVFLSIYQLIYQCMINLLK